MRVAKDEKTDFFEVTAQNKIKILNQIYYRTEHIYRKYTNSRNKARQLEKSKYKTIIMMKKAITIPHTMFSIGKEIVIWIIYTNPKLKLNKK